MEIYIISWIVLAIIIGAVGSGRNIGFWGSFFLSLLLSPLLGLIITLISKSKETVKYEQEVLKTQRQQQETLEQIKSQNISSMADDLKKIKDLLDNNVITEDEFETMKAKIMSNSNNSKTPNYTISELENENEVDESFIKYGVHFKNGYYGEIFKSKENGQFAINYKNEYIFYKSKELAIDSYYNLIEERKISEIGRINN